MGEQSAVGVLFFSSEIWERVSLLAEGLVGTLRHCRSLGTVALPWHRVEQPGP